MKKIKMNDVLQCPSKQENYDNTNIESIFSYAKLIENKTLLQILEEAGLTPEQIEWVRTKETDKGLPGKIIEASYFGYKLNPKQDADFDRVGVELKSTPADLNNKKKYVSGETLSITQIDFSHEIETNFYNSHLWNKLSWLLVIFYHRNKALQSKLNYNVIFASLFKPNDEDLAIIEDDYRRINKKIETGLAYTLSRSDGTYLSTAPKAQKKDSKIKSIYGGEEFTRRCYTLKKTYVQVILNGYYSKTKKEERIVKNLLELKTKSFPEILQDRFNPYINKTIEEIANTFNYKIKLVKKKDGSLTLSKATETVLTSKILGVKKLKNEEFTKAGIVVKTIVFNANGINRENFRLSDVDFFEIHNAVEPYEIEEFDDDGNSYITQYSGWEDSDLYKQLEDLSYFFVVYQQNTEGHLVLKGIKLWSMNESDINLAYKDWLDIKKILKEGVVLTRIPWGTEERTTNNFPGAADARLIHLRPHGDKSFYVDVNGNSWGNGKLSDTEPLPDGQRMVRQSYWLKNSFVRNIVSDLISTESEFIETELLAAEDTEKYNNK